MIRELVYITVTYACGCVAARPVEPPRQIREIESPHPCKSCQQKEQQAQKYSIQQTTLRYLVDGELMHIFCGKDGYWRGKRSGLGQKLKYFGKADPRPLLEEVLE